MSYASVLTICLTAIILAVLWAAVRVNQQKGK